MFLFPTDWQVPGEVAVSTPRVVSQEDRPDITQVKCDRNCSFPDKEFPSENIYFRLCGDRNQERELRQHFFGEGGGLG